MSREFTIVIPGAAWREAIAQIKEGVREAAAEGASYDVGRIFEFIRLTDGNRDLEQRLRKRGSFSFKAGRFLNEGVPVSQAIRDIDDRLGRIGVYVPRIIEVAVSGDVRLVFPADRQRRVVLSFRDRPPQMGFGTRFTLVDVEFEPAGVRYRFVQQDDETRWLHFLVDIGQERGQPRSSQLVVNLFDSATLLPNGLLPCACDCCQALPGRRPEPCADPGGPLEIRLHANVLVAPEFSVQQQIEATNTAFLSMDTKCNVKALRSLTLPHLHHYHAGECTSASTSPDQEELAAYRGASVGPLDIAVFWVDTITSASGSLAGCAAHPPGKPMIVMARSASRWVLAHEIGHLLGLLHTPKDPQFRTRLMYPRDNFVGTPQLTGAEQSAARCSPFSQPS